MINIEINFIEITITVFLTVFFQALFSHMFLTKRILEDIQKREELRQFTERRDNSK